MTMLSKKILLFAIALFLWNSSYSQEATSISPFLSFHLGLFNSELGNFSAKYESKGAILIGGSAGVQLSPSFAAFVEASSFSKKGSMPNLTSNASYSQWIVNIGIQQLLKKVDKLCINLHGGLFYANASEQITITTTNLVDLTTRTQNINADENGFYGLLLGLQIESIDDDYFSPYFLLQYDLDLSNKERSSGGNIGGVSICLGFRFEITKRLK
jgi:hypothetical protein